MATQGRKAFAVEPYSTRAGIARKSLADRAAVPYLGGLATQVPGLADDRLRDPVDRGVQGGDRPAGRLAGGEADLAPDHPPAQLLVSEGA